MKTFLAVVSFLLGCGFLLAQTPAQPTLSEVPLSPEQVAVYRAFLLDYVKDAHTQINLSEVTTKFEPDDGDFKGCMKNFTPTPALTAVHEFGNQFSDLHKIRLVNADKHQLADPGTAIRQGQSVNDAAEAGFAARDGSLCRLPGIHRLPHRASPRRRSAGRSPDCPCSRRPSRAPRRW